MIIFIVLGVFCLAGAAYFVGDAVTLPARERRVSVRRAANYGRSAASSAAASFRSRSGC